MAVLVYVVVLDPYLSIDGISPNSLPVIAWHVPALKVSPSFGDSPKMEVMLLCKDIPRYPEQSSCKVPALKMSPRTHPP